MAFDMHKAFKIPTKTDKMHPRDVCTKQCTIGSIGLLLVISGLMFGLFWSEIFALMMENEMSLTPESRSYEPWKSPPIQLSLDIYFFNWTNPQDFKNLSTKPILQELGPYRFTEKPDKVDINWHPENHTVSYRKKSDFFFDEEGSNGRLDDKITILNAVALSAAAKAKYWSYFRQKAVHVGLTMYNQPIAVTKSADELLFTGYNDDMIDIAREMPIFGDDVQVPFDKFGWFYTRNGSADLTGHFNMYTGTDDINKLGRMNTWNFKKNTGYFDSYCGMVNGSAGEFYPPNLNTSDTISFFSPDMCRSLNLDYSETVDIDGVKGYKFSGGLKSVDNGTVYPENRCFCGDQCVPSGVMNISSCRFGTPVFMSYPHFYNADPFYVNQVEGVSPNKSLHELYMVMEPNTGIALEVAARFQVNILVEPIPNIGLYTGVPKIYLPLIWFEQKVKIPSEMVVELGMIPTIHTIGHIAAGVIFAIGLILLCWIPTERYIRRRNNDFKQSPVDSISKKVSKDMEAAVPEAVQKQEASPLLNKVEKQSMTSKDTSLSKNNPSNIQT